MATKAEIRDRAANDLGRLRIGQQQLTNEHQVRIEAAYDEVYADLSDEGLAVWASDAAVPTKFVPHVVALVADNCLNTYSVSNDRYIRIKNAVSIAKREIRRMATPEYEGLDDPEDF